MGIFKLIEHDKGSQARAGELHTDHGIIPTPIFMPVGTQGTVKAIEQSQVKQIGYNLILGNTYHLYLRPGMEVVGAMKGLHEFMKWDGAILTDSGGYQVFSLNELRILKDDGVEFKSHIDGSKHFFSPEKVVQIQKVIGSDIVMVLDECAPYPASPDEIDRSVKLSISWAKMSKNAFSEIPQIYGHRQFLFGIGQGGMYPDKRIDYLNQLIDIGFDGYAIGGLSVGEPAELMYEMTGVCTGIMPKDTPRYLMGVGTPENILEAISLGIDMFDCVLPTRNARNGQIFTTRGKINVRNLKYKFSDEAIDGTLRNGISDKYSLAYLRHLFISNEILGMQLATYQNLAFYKWLVDNAREKILLGTYRQFKDKFINEFSKFED